MLQSLHGGFASENTYRIMSLGDTREAREHVFLCYVGGQEEKSEFP